MEEILRQVVFRVKEMQIKKSELCGYMTCENTFLVKIDILTLYGRLVG